MRVWKVRKLFATVIALALVLGLTPAFAADTAKAGTVYRNGNIYTMDDNNPHATAMAVTGDRLTFVGNETAIEAYIGPNTKVVDLGGKTVLPGLMEGHMHFFDEGIGKLMLNAFWKPKDVILASVKEAAANAKPGEWIQGNGWMNVIWEDDSFPTKEDLDAVAPNNPVLLNRADGHMIWVNSMAFELAGITNNTPDPQGGQYMKNSRGELLGCVTDTARTPIQKAVPAWSQEKQEEALLRCQEELFSYGFTSAMDAGTTMSMIDNYKKLYESGALKVRLYPLPAIKSTDSAEYKYVTENRPTGMLYNNRLHIAAVKILSDGSLGSRSAAMLEPYSDQAGWTGNYRFSDEELYKLVKATYDNGYQVCTHAIGDGGNHQTLDVYERVMTEIHREDPRMRIEHFQILTPEDIDRALKLGIIPAMQFTHATSDYLMAEDRIGSQRIQSAYAWRTVLDQGATIVGGSDADVELVNPYHGLYAGVTRQSRTGDPDGGWYPEQKITREEALKAFTIWVAHGQFEEKIKGSITTGKLADFVVIDRDYMTCPEDDIKDIQALMTVCGGEVVYTKDLSQPTIMWNGVPITFTDKVLQESSGIYANLSAITSNIGAEQSTYRGNVTVTYNGKRVTLPVRNVGGADYVAVRPLFEGLGYTVTWYPLSRTVSTHK